MYKARYSLPFSKPFSSNFLWFLPYIKLIGDLLYIILNEVSRYGFLVSKILIDGVILSRVRVAVVFISFVVPNGLYRNGTGPLLPLWKNSPPSLKSVGVEDEK